MVNGEQLFELPQDYPKLPDTNVLAACEMTKGNLAGSRCALSTESIVWQSRCIRQDCKNELAPQLCREVAKGLRTEEVVLALDTGDHRWSCAPRIPRAGPSKGISAACTSKARTSSSSKQHSMRLVAR